MKPSSGHKQAKRSAKIDEKLQRKYEGSITKSNGTPKARKETRKLSELKNPSDMTVDAHAERKLGLHKRSRDDDEPLGAHGGALVPARATHSRETLSVRGQRQEMVLEPAVPTPDLYQQLLEINRRQHRARNDQPRPMEELVGQGLLSTHIATLDERQDAQARQLRFDADFIAAQLRQLHRGAGGGTLTPAPSLPLAFNNSRKRAKTGEASDQAGGMASQVTLSIGFDSNEQLFGYELRLPNEKREHCFGLYDQDQETRRRVFLALDQLEEETPFCLRPTRYKMHRTLIEEEQARFNGRHTLPQQASSLVPRPPFEVVSREYIEQYLYRPPQHTGETCFNGQRCICYTYSPDPSVRYVARPFYTERQCQQLKRGEALDANRDGLCFLCQVLDWTRHHQRNITRQHSPSTFYNHFGVQVGPGQFNRDAMLEVVFNGRETGIIGHVPRFDEKKLCVAFVTRRSIQASNSGSVQPYAEAYIGLQGMDF